MNDREQNQNDILARCIRYDSTGELHRGEERIMHAQRQEHCLRRAMWLMAILSAFAALGLGHSLILLHELPPYQTRVINHVFTVLGLASLLSLLGFAGFWLLSRQQLAARREEARRLILRLLAERTDRRSAAENA